MEAIEIEVFRDDLRVAHLDCEVALEESDQLEDAGRVHDPVLKQRVGVGKLRHILAEQEILFDESPHAGDNRLAHCDTLHLCDFLAGKV